VANACVDTQIGIATDQLVDALAQSPDNGCGDMRGSCMDSPSP
jgi:hypothetical protein